MPVDPGLAALLALMDAPEVPKMHTQTPQQARDSMREASVAGRAFDAVYAVPVEITELAVPGAEGPLPSRLYSPPEAEGLLLFLHGGGFVVGDLETYDAQLRVLAARTGLAVLAPEYRLAPEAPYPAAVLDCEAAARWTLTHAVDLVGPAAGDPARLVVGGDSAGGNLAAVVCLRLAQDPGAARFAAQLLVYPTTSVREDDPSMSENAEGYFLTEDTMRWFNDHYSGPTPPAPDDWSRSPLAAPDELLAATPPAVLVTAEFDPLRDQGNAYADRLDAVGVPLWRRSYPGMIHGYLAFGSFSPAADAAVTEMCQALREVLGLPALADAA